MKRLGPKHAGKTHWEPQARSKDFLSQSSKKLWKKNVQLFSGLYQNPGATFVGPWCDQRLRAEDTTSSSLSTRSQRHELCLFFF